MYALCLFSTTFRLSFGGSMMILRICTKPVAGNNGAGGFMERTSNLKRALSNRKVKIKKCRTEITH